MLKVGIIVFREMLEIVLLVSTIYAFTKNIPRAKLYIALGVLLGTIGSIIISYIASFLDDYTIDIGQDFGSIIALLSTILMIAWTIFWVKARNLNLQQNLSKLNNIEDKNIRYSLSIMVAAIIFREGAEIVLFVSSIASVSKMSLLSIAIAVLAGIVSALMLGSLMYIGISQFSNKQVFNIISVLLIFIAAGLSAEVATIINAQGILTNFDFTLWNSSWLVKDTSITGLILNSLIGYHSNPSCLQVIFYLFTFIAIYIGKKYYNNVNNNI